MKLQGTEFISNLERHNTTENKAQPLTVKYSLRP